MDGGGRLRLRLFGSPSATTSGGLVSSFSNRKVALLAAYLATKAGERCDRRVVAKDVWPDVAPESALASLRNALSLLKKDLAALGHDSDAALRSDRTDVWLDDGYGTSDVQAFLSGSEKGPFEPWRFCEGFGEPWVSAQRAALTGLFEERLESVVVSLLETGESSRAADLAVQASDADPESERKLRLALRALTQAGRGADAIRRYRTFESGLRSRLGIGPSDETVALAREARRRSSHRRRWSASNVPTSLPPIFGREDLVDEVVAYVTRAEGAGRIVTFYGPGGVGKTRLALEVAKRSSSGLDGHVWFVDCSSVQAPEGLAARLWDVLGREETDRPESGFDGFLGGVRGLVVLDNLEQVVPDPGPVVQALVTAEPGLSVVATSRTLLAVPEERSVGVATLGVPDEDGSWQDSPSVSLYVDRARLLVPDYQIDDPTSLSELVRRLDGLPLAICLAAAHADLFSPSETLARLDRRFEVLQEDSDERPDRHKRLWACIDWSHSMHPEIHDTLRCLSVFRDGWTVENAERARQEPGTASHLQTALRASLVQAVARGSTVRFDMLESIREFVRAKAGTEGLEDARRRHATAMHTWAVELRAKSLDFNQQYLESRSVEYDNFRTAMEWCLDHEPTWALDFVTTFAYYWYSRDMYREGEAWIRKALEANTDGPSGPIANAYRALSTLYVGLTRYDEAVESLTIGFRHLPEDTVPYERGRFLNSKGNALMQAMKFDEAKEAFREALEYCKLAEDVQLALAVRLNDGFAHYLEGDLQEAERVYSETIAELRSGDNDDWLANNLHNFGLVALADGRLHDAKDRLSEARRIVEARGLDPAPRSWVSDAVMVAARLGEVDEARALLRRSALGVLASSGVGRLVECAEAAVEVALAAGDREEAVGLLAVIVRSKAQRQRSLADTSPLPRERLQELKDALSAETFAQAKERYRGWSLADLLEYLAAPDDRD
ncbi:MAG: hypothetical protein JST30_03495 [Armatimonadetes bacterium]|nr:hypothetical protein [Armatimonadota bacterium]